MKFSIVIPCYNCASTLAETLDSVVSQNYDSYEIVLVNDGSRDNTHDVIENYTKTHNCDIKYICQENKGVSCTRNAGIEAASGEYIVFLDADDIMAPGLLNAIGKCCAENDTDVVYCRRAYGIEKALPVGENVPSRMVTGEYMMRCMMYHMGIYSFCCFAYNANILKKEELRFTPGSKYGEDWELAIKYLSRCKKGVFLDAVGFYFRILETSASRTIVYEQTHAINSASRVLEYLEKSKHSMLDECNRYLYIKAVFSVAHRFAAAGERALLDRLKKEYDLKENMKRLVRSGSVDWKTRAMALLYLVHPELFSLACGILG